MVDIVEQPRLTFGRYKETYRFDLTGRSSGLPQRIAQFYEASPIRDLKIARDGLGVNG